MKNIVEAIRRNRDVESGWVNQDNVIVLESGVIVVDLGECYRFYMLAAVNIPGSVIGDETVEQCNALFGKDSC